MLLLFDVAGAECDADALLDDDVLRVIEVGSPRVEAMESLLDESLGRVDVGGLTDSGCSLASEAVGDDGWAALESKSSPAVRLLSEIVPSMFVGMESEGTAAEPPPLLSSFLGAIVDGDDGEVDESALLFSVTLALAVSVFTVTASGAVDAWDGCSSPVVADGSVVTTTGVSI